MNETVTTTQGDIFPEVALVTGGGSGIGRATALRLAGLGAAVVIGYNARRDAAEETLQMLPGTGHMAVQISIDDSASVSRAAALVAERFGRLDVLVNNGGATTPVPADDLEALSDAIFDQVLVVNLRGPFAMVRAFRPLLERGSHAAVVNVSSIAARTGVGSSLAYCAAKGGLDSLTVGLAKVLAPKVRVFSVSPAGVDTGFVPGRSRARLEEMAARMPLQTVTSADDGARAVVACVCHLTSATGIVVAVDEGRHL